MPGLLSKSIQQAMVARPPQSQPPTQPSGNPDDPLAGLEPATPEEERYVEDVFSKISEKMYKEGTTERIADMIQKAPPQLKMRAVITAAQPFMDMADEIMMQMPVPPIEDAGHAITDRIVDAIMEIADVSGAMPYDDNAGLQALVGVRNAYIQAHPEQSGGQPNAQAQPTGGTPGPSQRGGGSGTV